MDEMSSTTAIALAGAGAGVSDGADAGVGAVRDAQPATAEALGLGA